MDAFLHLFEDLRPAIPKSGLRVSFPAYVSLIMLSTVVAFSGGFLVSMIVGITFGAAVPVLAAIAFAIGLLGGALTFVVLYAYPSVAASSRRRQLEDELPYLISHMAVLATAGVTPERIFRSLAGAGQKDTLTEDAKMIVRDVDLLGLDLLSALEAARDRSPSKSFADFLEGLLATTRSGGDLRKYFLSTARGVMETRRIAAKQFTDTLGTLAEVYVGALVVFPLVVIIMFSVMGIVSGSLAGFDITTLMFLLTYALLPMLGAMVLILLDAIIPKW